MAKFYNQNGEVVDEVEIAQFEEYISKIRSQLEIMKNEVHRLECEASQDHKEIREQKQYIDNLEQQVREKNQQIFDLQQVIYIYEVRFFFSGKYERSEFHKYETTAEESGKKITTKLNNDIMYKDEPHWEYEVRKRSVFNYE